MTIDEYLNQLSILKLKADAAGDKCDKAYNKATSLPSGIKSSGSPSTSKNVNANEIRLTEYADAARKWREALNKYKEFSDQLYSNICNCLYLDGLLLVTAYINNVVFEYDTLHGIGSILDTSDTRAMINRLNEAKEHLREVLIRNGVDIE